MDPLRRLPCPTLLAEIYACRPLRGKEVAVLGLRNVVWRLTAKSGSQEEVVVEAGQDKDTGFGTGRFVDD